ncbi:unnamed protein product [Scytosiphon promiscuus]
MRVVPWKMFEGIVQFREKIFQPIHDTFPPRPPRNEKHEVCTGTKSRKKVYRGSHVAIDPKNCVDVLYFDKSKPSSSIRINTEVSREAINDLAQSKNDHVSSYNNDEKVHQRPVIEKKSDEFGRRRTGAQDRIYVLTEHDNQMSNAAPVDVSPFLEILPGEEAEYLSEFTRVVGGDVTLDRRRHTAKVQVFAGAKATTTECCETLLDTGSPASFIQERCSSREVRRRLVST